MTKKTQIKIATQILALYLMPAISTASWVDDFVDRATVTSTDSGRYESGGRTFATGGVKNMRWSSKAENPFSINPPKLGGGCGGIDAYLGGVSFLDEEYLVNKFEAIITNAPAVAFDIAMKQMSAQLSETMGKFEDIINGLNSIQLSDCGIAKAGVVSIRKDGGSWSDAPGAMWEESIKGFKQGYENSSKNRDAAASTMNDQPVAALFNGCPSAEYKGLMNTGGSLLAKMATMNTPLIEAGLTAMLRGVIGDVQMRYDVSAGPAKGGGSFKAVPSQCGKADSGMEQTFSNYLKEGIYSVQSSVPDSDCGENRDDRINVLLNSAMDKLSATPTGALSQQERNVVYMTGFPMEIALKSAKQQSKVVEIKGHMREVLPVIYAYNMFNQAISSYQGALIKIKTFVAASMVGVDKNQCPSGPPEALSIAISSLEDHLRDQQKKLRTAYTNTLKDKGIDLVKFKKDIEDLANAGINENLMMMNNQKR